jgi:hypothetical protein
MAKPTIAEIKEKTREKCPFYFSHETLKFFGQRMDNFTVHRSPQGRIFIAAPRFGEMTGARRLTGYSFREFTGDDLAVVRGDDGELLDTDTAGAWQRIRDYIQNH